MQRLCEGYAGGYVVSITLLYGDIAVLGNVFLISRVSLSLGMACRYDREACIENENKVSDTSRDQRGRLF